MDETSDVVSSFLSLLRVSVPVDTLCTRYSKKYNAWMDLSWKRRR